MLYGVPRTFAMSQRGPRYCARIRGSASNPPPASTTAPARISTGPSGPSAAHAGDRPSSDQPELGHRSATSTPTPRGAPPRGAARSGPAHRRPSPRASPPQNRYSPSTSNDWRSNISRQRRPLSRSHRDDVRADVVGEDPRQRLVGAAVGHAPHVVDEVLCGVYGASSIHAASAVSSSSVDQRAQVVEAVVAGPERSGREVRVAAEPLARRLLEHEHAPARSRAACAALNAAFPAPTTTTSYSASIMRRSARAARSRPAARAAQTCSASASAAGSPTTAPASSRCLASSSASLQRQVGIAAARRPLGAPIPPVVERDRHVSAPLSRERRVEIVGDGGLHARRQGTDRGIVEVLGANAASRTEPCASAAATQYRTLNFASKESHRRRVPRDVERGAIRVDAHGPRRRRGDAVTCAQLERAVDGGERVAAARRGSLPSSS